MNTRKLLLVMVAALLGLVANSFAQTQTTEAAVKNVTGTATVALPDGSTKQLVAGMTVPQGATITTGADGDVMLESHAGYVTAIKANSTVVVEELSVTRQGGQVKEEKTLLNLKSGDLVALLDAKKKNVNNYQVRTPKGVAAARGTKFAVKVYGQEATIAVVNGQVQLTFQGSLAFTMGQGQVMDNGRVQSISDYAANAPIFQAFLAEIVASVAVAAEKGIGGATSADVAQVTQTIVAAVPSLAPQIAQTVQQYAPSQSSTVQQTVQSIPGASTTPSTTQGQTGGGTTPTTSTPQVINPATVSRSE